MTTTLTEQWKDMDLGDEHLYYWRMPNGEVRIMSKMGVCSYKLCYDGGEIDNLAPVPSYDEYKRLQEQLNEANEVIKKTYDQTYNSEWSKLSNKLFEISEKYLEKWGVK